MYSTKLILRTRLRTGRIFKASTQRGFTLIELLVTIGIIMIITAIVVVQHGAFNSTVLLRSQAYEIALNLREAQVFSISARGEGSNFRDAYGLYFSADTPNTYVLFADNINENSRYDDGEEIDQFVIDSRFTIVDLQIGANCDTSVDDLSIAFKRPDFDAHISSGGGSIQAAGCIVVASEGGSDTRSVFVRTTGQIEVQ